MIKTIYLYLIKKYIPPFLGTLFITVFVFFMIFVFTYIDEIAGKGIDAITLVKMFGYTFLMFIPQSIPLAVLLSSIMTFGGLGETYELAAMKSSGLSLLKIMRPILMFIVVLSIFSFAFSNYTMPFIHLKQSSILYDVRGAKPTLNIKESVFYNGIEGYSIRIGKKDVDGQTIRNITIYDHHEGKGNLVQMYADSGMLQTSGDKNALVMTLFNGNRYQQVLENHLDYQRRPMISAAFQKQVVFFDLSGFQLKRTDEDLFRNNAEMMNVSQLTSYMDTIKKENKELAENVFVNFAQYFNPRALRVSNKIDSLNLPYMSVHEYISRFDPVAKKQLYEIALNQARSSSAFLDGKMNEEKQQREEQAKFEVNWHKKFTLSFACIVLFFVGAPLGAIVRKGGLGMPVVISVVLFIIYHVISFTCEKMALEGQMNPTLAMWVGPTIFLPFGIWLSIKAAKDSALFDIGDYFKFFGKIISVFKSKKTA
ncbi:MAG: LptF/LptG family permease [Bacteroidetes bacterium]|nr:LptF/LptG family permease [Bacteroidota bacterium]